jgi:hypothetical protein
MEKLIYVGEDDEFIYYSLHSLNMQWMFKFSKRKQTLSVDMDSVACSLGYKDAIDMMSDDNMLDFLNTLKEEFGKWPFADLTIEKNN